MSTFLKVMESNRILGFFYRYLSSSEHEEDKALSKFQIFVLAILLLTSLTLSLRNFNSFHLGSYQDDASYAVLAKSIVTSDAYGLINNPGEPLLTRYPFGFPLLLSPFAWLFPFDVNWMKLVSLIATLINIFLILWGWSYLSQGRSYWWGIVVSGLYAVSPMVIGHSSMVMSEPVFTTFVLASLILTEKYITREKTLLGYILISGGVIFYSLFIRTIGIALLAAVIFRILFLPFNGYLKMRRIIYLLIGGIAIVTMIVAVTPIKITNLLPIEYSAQYENPKIFGLPPKENALIPRTFNAFLDYAGIKFRDVVIPIGGGSSELEFGQRFGIPNLPLISGFIVGFVILLGTLSVFQKQGLHPSVLLFEVFYLGLLLIWPGRTSRLLYPIQPFLLFHLLCGVDLIARQLWRVKLIPSNVTRLIPRMSVSVVFFIIFFLSIYKGILNKDVSTQFIRDLTVGTIWLRENSPSDAVIMAQQPQGVYIYSGRHTIDYPSEDNFNSLDQFDSFLRKNKIDYIIIAPAMVWRQDGSLKYDKVTAEKVIPILNQMDQLKTINMIYQSEPDLVKIYQVLRQ